MPRLIDPAGPQGEPPHQGSSGKPPSGQAAVYSPLEAARQPEPGEAQILCIVPTEALDLALAADHVLGVYQAHRAIMMGGVQWTERDRAAFDALGRAARRFWSRDRGQES